MQNNNQQKKEQIQKFISDKKNTLEKKIAEDKARLGKNEKKLKVYEDALVVLEGTHGNKIEVSTLLQAFYDKDEAKEKVNLLEGQLKNLTLSKDPKKIEEFTALLNDKNNCKAAVWNSINKDFKRDDRDDNGAGSHQQMIQKEDSANKALGI
jgi:hypothetical protein